MFFFVFLEKEKKRREEVFLSHGDFQPADRICKKRES
jgi:hypothetical protein